MKNVKVKLELSRADIDKLVKVYDINVIDHKEYLDILDSALDAEIAVDIAIHLAHNEDFDVVDVVILEDG